MIDLADIHHHFTSCGAVGRKGPSVAQCETWYSEHNISLENRLFSFTDDNGLEIFKGAQGFRVPRTGLYNVTVAGAAGGRGICHFQRGMGLLWKGIIKLLDTQDVLVQIGQKGLEPCDLSLDIPFCESLPDNSSKCFNDWMSWVSSRPGLSENAASLTTGFGGGGSGGGASMLRLRDRKTGSFNELPVVVAGGGGGMAALFSPDVLNRINVTFPPDVPSNASMEHLYESFINAKPVDRDFGLIDIFNFSGIRGYVSRSADIFSLRPGAGGGYFPVPSVQNDGAALNTSENFAIGGLDCLNLRTTIVERPLFESVHGGFGGGGGQCESGGSGGGFTGGSVFSNQAFGIPGNGGFFSFFSDSVNSVVEVTNELNFGIDGFVEIVPYHCGCGHLCVMDEEANTFECICPDNSSLAPNGFDCYKGMC